jgi:hypothetical protein
MDNQNNSIVNNPKYLDGTFYIILNADEQI